MVAAPRTRTVIASIVASCALLASSAMQAHAAPQASSVLPAPNPASQQGQLLSSQLDDLFARYSPVDHLRRPTPETAAQIRNFAHQPWVPPQAKDAILQALDFAIGAGETGGPDLPKQGPQFTQFGWPTVAGSCINGTHNSVGTAIAVPGPADIPLPGAKAHETAFLFTALGTAPAAQHQDMRAHWFNLSNGKHGSIGLGNHGINPEGPATISGVADTGRGIIVALVEGSVHTEDSTCNYFPTAAIITS
ncbi:hypothetical protein QP905_05545 [Corynebacterium pseudodiphtheriticum]|uniref:Rv1157c family protein n=1 Tax=Corynebacterium pseudodiphtheriticum TaxID=37637 RepID=UPI0025503176|nr:hypothetical protein [Corynebacterium pseudodiphtheriticum]MDK8577809.1 hypothetical protein [Corynebacterium pseudodiphtheriticum]